MHSAPASCATRWTSGLSVAITHRSATPSAMTRCQTRMTMGTPARSRSGLRGSRVAESRAGMIASVLTAMNEWSARPQIARSAIYDLPTRNQMGEWLGAQPEGTTARQVYHRCNYHKNGRDGQLTDCSDLATEARSQQGTTVRCPLFRVC